MKWPSKLWKKLRKLWLVNLISAQPVAAAGLVILLASLPQTQWARSNTEAYSSFGYLFLILIFFLGLLAPAFARQVLRSGGLKPWFYLVGLLASYLFFFSGSYFYSDDSIRHELDGHYIARGLPLYCLGPQQLGLQEAAPAGIGDSASTLWNQKPESLPNHSHLSTIYLPGTQLISYLGALGPGYRILFSASSWIMMAILLIASFRQRLSHGNAVFESARTVQLAGVSSRPQVISAELLLTLFSHPFWMILFYSGHSDVTAFLLCLLALRFIPGNLWSRLLAGIFWSLACSMKPEAILGGITLLWAFTSVHPSGRNQQSMIFKSRFIASLRAIAPVLAGCLLVLVLMIPFILFDLFHLSDLHELRHFSTSEGSSLEFECFFYTARIYSNHFLSYRPDAVWLSSVEGLSSFESIRLVRMITLPAWAVLILGLWPGLSSNAASARVSQPGGDSHNSENNQGQEISEFRQQKWALWSLRLFLYFLLGYFLYRGSWQPWYFLWILLAPGLWLQKRPFQNQSPEATEKSAKVDTGTTKNGFLWLSFFLSLLVLFYLPVINYRVDGSFHLSFFYYSFLLALTVAIMLYFYGSQRKGRRSREPKKDR